PKMSNTVDLGGATGAGMIWRAAAAIEAGMCETVVCVLANKNEKGKALRSPNRNPIREFDVPFGASGANTSYALLKREHMEVYGSKQEDFARIAYWARKNALKNPKAIFYNQPVELEDILQSPMIADPLRLLEIVMPCAGGAAVIVTSEEKAKQANNKAVYLKGAGEKITHRAVSQAPTIDQLPFSYSIPHALQQAEIEGEDLDLLSLYDCYTSVVAVQLESIGICKPGEFGDFVNSHTFGHDGDYPLNTHGGQLGFGQADLAGGMSHVIEAVVQLRGEGGERQIPNPKYALVTGNGATLSETTALVLGGEQ
ncbi:acetyl-CoA acetyltransferase, partial [Corynebacterium diphtheriae]